MVKGSGHPPVNKFCEFCKKEFQVIYKSRHQTCCSLKCSSLYGWSLKGHRKTFTKPCDVCGNTMETRPDRIKDGRGRYCSKKCYVIAMKRNYYPHTMSEESRDRLSKMRVGKLNPAYIHGNNKNCIRYAAGFTSKLRNIVKTRDNFTCQICGKTERLDVHHIDKNPLHNELSNLITWCRSCHMSYHHKKS